VEKGATDFYFETSIDSCTNGSPNATVLVLIAVVEDENNKSRVHDTFL